MIYAVARVITSPTGAVRTARLVIDDVPDKTTVHDVLAALEAAGKAAEFSEGGVPFGNHEIKGNTRGWPFAIAGIEDAPRITWAKLTAPPSRADGRRVTLRLTDAEHARYTLAAQRSGLSLQEWMVEAAEAHAAEAPAAPAPAPRVSRAVHFADAAAAPTVAQ